MPSQRQLAVEHLDDIVRMAYNSRRMGASIRFDDSKLTARTSDTGIKIDVDAFSAILKECVRRGIDRFVQKP